MRHSILNKEYYMHWRCLYSLPVRKDTFIPSDYDMSLIFSDFAGNKFTPAASSPLVNAGITSDPEVSAMLAKYAKDLAGNPRVAGASVDLGCYELQ